MEAAKSGRWQCSQGFLLSAVALAVVARICAWCSNFACVNHRTGIYGQRYQGEQASDPDIQKELAGLALRQQKIFEVTNNIARGKNK